ncbi:MAG: ATP-binding protein [Candidatus Chisholmbacteria bacterium]|nr:ATP-binding protein [Candidatus Chisholmbacteria bacterium]
MYRQVFGRLEKLLVREKPPVILILGMRQAGKTTLAENLGKTVGEYVRFNFDLVGDRREFVGQDRHSLALFAQRYKGKLIIVDEVQKMPEATAVVKHLYDTFGTKFILTGSSEVKIRRGLGDTLAGRVHEERLYPLSLSEINVQAGLNFDPAAEFNNYDENQKNLMRYLVWGSLPQLQNIDIDQHRMYLEDLVNTLVSKDVLEISGTRKTTQVYLLARLLAMQIGQLVNFNELAINTELSRESVYRYIDIFEQMGLVIRAKPISTNEREAISKATKMYFSDLGVRNALTGDWSDWRQRADRGQLLENAVFVGIKRANEYAGWRVDLGFFRSAYGAEIDIVEKSGDKQRLFEVKASEKKNMGKKGVEVVTPAVAQKYLY